MLFVQLVVLSSYKYHEIPEAKSFCTQENRSKDTHLSNPHMLHVVWQMPHLIVHMKSDPLRGSRPNRAPLHVKSARRPSLFGSGRWLSGNFSLCSRNVLANGVYCLVIYEGAPVMLEKVDVDISSIFCRSSYRTRWTFKSRREGNSPRWWASSRKGRGLSSPDVYTYERARIN